jgi:hypothetical protein
MIKDTVESKRIGRLLRAKKQQCYRNAFRLIQEVPEYSDADYVEGIAVVAAGFLIEHGWVEKDGVIIDPTLPDNPINYFSGLRFHGQLGLAKAMTIPKLSHTKDLPIFFRFGWGGIDSPEFRAAQAAANRHIGCEDVAVRYEEYGHRALLEMPIENSEAASVV